MALSSREVDDAFLDVLKASDVWAKQQHVHARQLDVDEEIMLNDGQTQTKKNCKANEWVVVSPAGEQYSMSNEAFKKRYNFDKAQRARGDLGAQGFATYPAKGKVRARILTKDDVDKFRNGCFVPPWSESDRVYVTVGGVLVLPVDDNGVPPPPQQDKDKPAGIYFIPRREFAWTYAREYDGTRLEPQDAGEREAVDSSQHMDSFNTHMKCLLPEGDNVSEACVRPTIGEDPSYLVVTTNPSLRLLVFRLDSFKLELSLSLKQLGATNFAPFCSFHRNYSLLHVSYQVFQWSDLAKRFEGKDVAKLPPITTIGTTASRFTVFTPTRAVWKKEKTIKHKKEGKGADSFELGESQADNRMVASASAEKVFVVVTNNGKCELRILALKDGDKSALGDKPCVDVGQGRLVPFAAHPSLLFVVDESKLLILQQDNFDRVVVKDLKWELVTELGVLLSPHPNADLNSIRPLVASRKEVFQIVPPDGKQHHNKVPREREAVAVSLASVPRGAKVVAVHEHGMVVGDGRGHLLSMSKSSHPVQNYVDEPRTEPDGGAPNTHRPYSQRPQPLLVCADPRSNTLVIAYYDKLVVRSDCRLDNCGGERVELHTKASGPLDALCVDWGNKRGTRPLAFLAHEGGVEVFDISAKKRLGSISQCHGALLCVVRGASGGRLWSASEAKAGRLGVLRRDSIVPWADCEGSSAALFVCCKAHKKISRFDMDALVSALDSDHPPQPAAKPPAETPVEGANEDVLRLLSLGDCAVAIRQHPSDSEKVTIQRLFILQDEPEVNARAMNWKALGSTHRRLVGPPSDSNNNTNTNKQLDIYNRQGISVYSYSATGEVVHVAAEQINRCVVFVTKNKGADGKDRWMVCLLKTTDNDNDNDGDGDGGEGGEEGEGASNKGEGGGSTKREDEIQARPVGTQWLLASFRNEVKACHVMKDSIAVHCDGCVRVINMRPFEHFPEVYQLFASHPPEGDAFDNEEVVRGVASGREVFWSRLLRRPEVLHSALAQTKLRVLPLISIPSLLNQILTTCNGPQQEGLVDVVLQAYMAHLEGHNKRRQGGKDATEGWEVDFHAIDDSFLKVLLVVVEEFPAVAANFLCHAPLVRLPESDEKRVFDRGVPSDVEARARTSLVVRSSEALDGMDWKGGEHARPRTVGDYVVPFPTHARDSHEDLLVGILNVNSEEFVDGIALKTVITHRWDTYACGMHAVRLVLFFISLGLTTTVSFFGPSSTPLGTVVGVFAALGLLVVLSIARGAKELWYSRQTVRQFVQLPFRNMEIARVSLTFACMATFVAAAKWGGGQGERMEKWFRGLASALVFVHWIGLLRLLQPYRAFGPPIRTIAQIAWDVRYFLLVMAVAVLAICNAVYTALMPSERKDNYKHVPIALYTSFKSTVLGDVDLIDTLEVDHSARRWLFRTLALMASLLVTVVLLNLLIAIMGDSHSHIQERAEIEFQLLRARMIVVQQSHYGSLKALMDFGLGGGGVERGPEEGKKGAPRFRSASSYSQLQCEDEPEANAGRFPVSARWPKPVVGFARWVVWLVFAYPMDRVLSLAGAKRDAMYHPWLHVLVAHHLSMDDVSNSGRWQGALHVLKAQITDQVAKQAEVDQKQDKRLLDIETNLKSVLGHLSNKPDSK